jgi:hypothetical protein
VYEIRIVHGDYLNRQQVKAVANVIGGNFLRARKLLQKSRSLVFKGDAQKAKQARDSLLAAGIELAIYPEFPW